ncbi:MAG: MFS transporter [Elusimicrobia bacterium RIFOXYB2_FULL_49_7]|nr:MAG: MFS transporter [Elusimicrobia bacterium RIFOXYB2_FULL_49_7]
MSTSPETVSHPGRGHIAFAGVFLQLCLGTVYAWSYFQKPLMAAYGWNNSQTAWTFSLAIFFLGLAAAWGGCNLERFGPRRLASLGGLLFGLGYLLASLALARHSLWLLYVGYGIIGGIGLGLAYVTPVATVAKWFPDKKGLMTGLVVMGFGLGALLMSKVAAPALLSWTTSPDHPTGNLIRVFFGLGLFFLVCTLSAAALLKNPPMITPLSSNITQNLAETRITSTMLPVWRTSTFYILWALFFCNIASGIAIIGFQSPLYQDLVKVVSPELTTVALAAAGATLIGISSLFNGIGRLFWAALSDRIGRLTVFRILLLSQALVFLILPHMSKPIFFALLVCYILLCYGGGFGTMPSFILDRFGPLRMAPAYGLVLTAWSAAGVVGPQVTAYYKDHFGDKASAYSFLTSSIVLTIGFALSFLLKNKREKSII